MLASSRKAMRRRKAPRRAKSPALHCGRKQAPTRKCQPTVRPAAGPMKSSAPTQRGGTPQPSSPTTPAVPGCAARMPCIVGRAFTPAGEVCATPEGYWQGKVPHPSVAWGDTSPCRGGFIGGSPPKASPARGGGCAGRRRRRGALPLCGKNILQGPAGPCPASVGDDACIVPETLRWRKAPAAGEIARPTKPPRAGSNAQTPAIRQARRRADASIGPYEGGGGREACGGLPFPISPLVCLAL